MKITFSILIKTLLPFHKRQPVRLAWLGVFASVAQQEFDILLQAYYNALKSLQVNSQAGILQHHLRDITQLPAIEIRHYKQDYLNVGLEIETVSGTLIGVENETGVSVSLLEEYESLTDYQIHIPASIGNSKKAIITKAVELHRLAGKTFGYVYI